MTFTAIEIKRAPDGKLWDANGLFVVKSGASGKWVYRYSIHGKQRDMGLGSWPSVSLAEARKTRDRWAVDLRHGGDPIATRQNEKASAADAANKADPTFAEMVTVVFNSRKATLRGDGLRGRCRSPLDTHIIPKVGRKPISKITPREIQDALAPIWQAHHPTALKACQRTRMVFAKSKLMGYACDPFTVDAARAVFGGSGSSDQTHSRDALAGDSGIVLETANGRRRRTVPQVDCLDLGTVGRSAGRCDGRNTRRYMDSSSRSDERHSESSVRLSRSPVSGGFEGRGTTKPDARSVDVYGTKRQTSHVSWPRKALGRSRRIGSSTRIPNQLSDVGTGHGSLQFRSCGESYRSHNRQQGCTSVRSVGSTRSAQSRHGRMGTVRDRPNDSLGGQTSVA